MDGVTGVLSALALISGLVHVGAAQVGGPRWLVYVFKPLTTSLILLIALVAPAPVSAVYQGLVVAGLAFSLAGDVFLMLPEDRFLPGLASFLVAHIGYVAAFASRSGLQATWGGALPFLLYGAAMLLILWPYLGRMKAPVIGYMIVISLMGWQALEQWLATGQFAALLALFGAGLFIVSDSALAVARFRKPFPGVQVLVLGTYYLAQWLIALSINSI